MSSVVVVPVEPVCQILGKRGPGFVSLQVDSLVFQGAPEPFDEDVVFEPPLAVHADLDVPSLEDGGKCFAGKLAPLVGVEYLRSAVFEQSFFERLNAESGVQRVGQSPGEDLSGGPVHDCYQVHKPPCHGDVGNISCPDLIRPVYGQPPQQVRVDRMLRLPPAGAWLGSQGFDPHDKHETADSASAHRGFRCCEVIGQGTASHPGMLQIKLVDPAHQLQVASSQP